MSNNLDVLLVEDNPADARLVQEAIKESGINIHLHVVADGIAAMDYLKNKTNTLENTYPTLILLDLNIPKMSGHDVLKEIKNDLKLRRIPVIILTSSKDPVDVNKSYNLYANCFITKPIELEEFMKKITQTTNFWLGIAKVPGNQD